MNRSSSVSAALSLSVASIACSSAVAPADSAKVLCAAEALYEARQPERSTAEGDRLRSRAARFREMLPAEQRDKATLRIDTLADARESSPLASLAECDALLAKPQAEEGA